MRENGQKTSGFPQTFPFFMPLYFFWTIKNIYYIYILSWEGEVEWTFPVPLVMVCAWIEWWVESLLVCDDVPLTFSFGVCAKKLHIFASTVYMYLKSNPPPLFAHFSQTAYRKRWRPTPSSHWGRCTLLLFAGTREPCMQRCIARTSVMATPIFTYPYVLE